MKTNHYVRVVTLATGERVLCLFGEVRDENGGVSGYRMAEPFNLTLGDPDDKGNMPIKYNRWCMFSPEREYRLSGIHIVSVSFPEETILDTYIEQLESNGITKEMIFYPEETNGDNSEPVEAAE